MSEGNLIFNSYLTNDQTSKYWLYFLETFGSDGAIIINDAGGSPITGFVSGSTNIAFSFDYTGNTQGGRTPGTDANYIAIAIGTGIAQYVFEIGRINSGNTNDIYLFSQVDWNRKQENVLSDIEYIDFQTGVTVSSSTGRLYFDSNENALSYFPDTPAMDVTLNIGQEELIKVYNNSGDIIHNGKVVNIIGSSGGTPTIGLANASGTDDLFQATGMATHDILNENFGFITSFGIVRDLDLSDFEPGDKVVLSDVISGGLSKAENLKITSRVTELGWVINGGSSGKLLIRISNESNYSLLNEKTANILTGDMSSTGVFYFSGFTIRTSTSFDVGPMKGWIVDNTTNPTGATVKYIDFTGITGVTTPYLTGYTETSVLVTSGGTLLLIPNFPNAIQRRQNIYLGKLGHANKISIVNVFNQPDFVLSPLSQVRDMFTPIKMINDGIYPYPDGNNLEFYTTEGKLYGFGIGFVNDPLNPDSVDINENKPCTFQYRTQLGGSSTNRTTIDPNNYDLNGVITPIQGGSKSATNQRIFLLQNGLYRIQYGQTVYNSLTEAVAGSQTEFFNTFINLKSVGILIGILSVVKSATDLSIGTQAKFLLVSKFGEGLGATGGLSTTSLQQAYENSTTPEIITNETLGALTFKRGTLLDSDNVLEIQNGSSENVATINAEGTLIVKKEGVNTLTPEYTLDVSGTTRIVLTDTGVTERLLVEGYSGDLLQVLESSDDVILSVNNSDGFPIIEALDSDKITMGTYNTNTFVVSGTSVGIGTDNISESAILEINSLTKGVRLPRLTSSQMNSIVNPILGLVLYNTTENNIYSYDGVDWIPLSFTRPKLITSDYTLLATDNILLISGSTNVTITMIPIANSNKNGYTLKNIGGGMIYFTIYGSETIDGDSNPIIAKKNTSITIKPYSNMWFIN